MIGEIIGGISSLIGGSMASKANKEATQMMLADKEKDRELQKEFAQTGIRWKAWDAKAAGLHPIIGIGGAGAAYTPSSIAIQPDTGMANAVAAAGQNIGRAVDATRSQGERNTAFTESVQKLTLDKMGLENMLLSSQIAQLNANKNPPLPVGDRYLIPGQSGSGVVSSLSVPGTIDTNPMKRTASNPALPHQEPGAINDTGFARTSGGLYPVPGNDIKERIEDNFWHESAHFLRNNFLPMVSPKFNDPPYKAPAGQAWVYDPIYGYKLVRDTKMNRFFRYNFN